eukprot:s5167_g2.t1
MRVRAPCGKKGRPVSPAAAAWSARIPEGNAGAKGASAKASQHCVGQTVFGTLLVGTTSTFQPNCLCLCVLLRGQDAQAKGGHGRRHKVLSTCSTGAIGPYLMLLRGPSWFQTLVRTLRKKKLERLLLNCHVCGSTCGCCLQFGMYWTLAM